MGKYTDRGPFPTHGEIAQLAFSLHEAQTLNAFARAAGLCILRNSISHSNVL
jgi:hypothetical protein